MDYLLNVSFSGLSHRIHFDSAGDIYGQYVILSKDVQHPMKLDEQCYYWGMGSVQRGAYFEFFSLELSCSPRQRLL